MNDTELLDAKRFAANLRADLTDPARAVERQHVVDLLVVVESLLVDRALEDAKRLQAAARLAARTPGLVGVENERLKGELESARADLAKREHFAQETERARAEDAAELTRTMTELAELRAELAADPRLDDLHKRQAAAIAKAERERATLEAENGMLRHELGAAREGLEEVRQGLSRCMRAAAGGASRAQSALGGS